MEFRFTPMIEADARAILAWRYDPPYAVYNAAADEPADFDYVAGIMDPHSPYFTARLVGDRGWEDEAPAGFFAFGSACEVGAEPDAPAEAHLRRADGSITVGLGLRPDLTGSGRGLPFVQAGLALARERYAPGLFRLFVYAWNQRAITVYERAGFTSIGRAGRLDDSGLPAFVEMTRRP